MHPGIFVTILLAVFYSSVLSFPHEGDSLADSQHVFLWPQWRGPKRDGISTEKNLIQRIPAEGVKIVWKRKLGYGYSGIVADEDQIFTIHAEGDHEYAVSFDVEDGAEFWSYEFDNIFLDNYGPGSRSTPVLDGNRVYYVSPRGKLASIRASDGKLQWQIDITETFRSGVPKWGFAASPLIHEEKLILPLDTGEGCILAAFDKFTGDVIWRCNTSSIMMPKDHVGYSSPNLMNLNGEMQIVTFTASQLVGMNLDGDFLWRFKWVTRYAANVMMPLQIDDNRIFISSGYNKGAALVEVSKKDNEYKTKRLWKSKVMRNDFSSPVLWDGHIYGFDRRTLKCVEAATGKQKWKKNGLGHGSLIFADNQLIVLSEDGRLLLVEPTNTAYREKGSARVITGLKIWTPPSLANGKLYIRNQHEIVCIDMRSKPDDPATN